MPTVGGTTPTPGVSAYRPLDNSSRFASDLRGLRSANSIENAFQGGKGAADQFAGDVRRIP